MPSVAVKLYSVFFKVLLKHKLLNSGQSPTTDGYVPAASAVSRPPTNGVPANSAFENGIATKDINVDPFTTLSLRIFLPQSALPQDQINNSFKTGLFGYLGKEEAAEGDGRGGAGELPNRERRANYGGGGERRTSRYTAEIRGNQQTLDVFSRQDGAMENTGLLLDDSEDLVLEAEAPVSRLSTGHYGGYLPEVSDSLKKLPIIIQFHGGGFVTGSKDSASNDMFCRRMAKLCDAVVIAVGYRLAPEHRYPAAFDDGFEALRWLANQANLAECNKSLGRTGSDVHRPDRHREIVNSFGGSTMVEPWIAAHGDPSRCVLLGVSSGANIANHVAKKAVKAGKLLEPVKVLAQVMMYPFFLGSIPTRSEIKLANSYFYDKGTCLLAWKLFLPQGEYDPDHSAVNPLVHNRGDPPLKLMPPTLTIVAEHDWMKDRAIAYSEALRKANIDAPVLEYKDAVHEFATLDFLIKSRQAEVCAEDMAIWMKKYLSLKGHEFSY